MSNVLLAPITPATRNYVRAFDLHAIAQFADGRIAVTSNPAGAIAVWWCEGKRDAGFVAKLATSGKMSVVDAARQLNIRIAPHEHVVARAETAVARLNASLAKANGDGALQAFNRQYRAQREAARSRGRSYMTYEQARFRLQRVLAEHAAGTAPSSLFAKVFER